MVRRLGYHELRDPDVFFVHLESLAAPLPVSLFQAATSRAFAEWMRAPFQQMTLEIFRNTFLAPDAPTSARGAPIVNVSTTLWTRRLSETIRRMGVFT